MKKMHVLVKRLCSGKQLASQIIACEHCKHDCDKCSRDKHNDNIDALRYAIRYRRNNK